MNGRELDKIDTEGAVHRLDRSETLGDDEVYHIDIKKEFGGVSSRMVRTLNNLVFIAHFQKA